MFESDYQLILYPERHEAKIESSVIRQILLDIDFIEATESNIRFHAGDRFLSLLCFLGCSPDIELYPQDDKPYCYIDLPEMQTLLGFISGRNVKAPRCPHCRKDLKGLAETLHKQENKLGASCEYCQELIKPSTLNWRKSACFLHSAIVIGNIYEAEAVPDIRLLDILKDRTGEIWKYSYIRRDKK